MARILIYKNKSGKRSDGSDYYNPIATTAFTPTRTVPVRAFGGPNDIRYINYEFVLDNNPLVNTIGESPNWFAYKYNIKFYQEFFNDKISMNNPPPNLRNWDGMNENIHWAREVSSELSSGGSVVHYPVVRQVNMQGRKYEGYKSSNDGSVYDECLSFPFAIHTLWTRLVFYVDIAETNSQTEDSMRTLDDELFNELQEYFNFRIFAHVGGHIETKFLEEHGNEIYIYNANSYRIANG